MQPTDVIHLDDGWVQIPMFTLSDCQYAEDRPADTTVEEKV